MPNVDQLFEIANSVALAGWIALLAAPWAPTFAQRTAGLAIPLLLAVLYTGLMAAFWSRAEGSFFTLADVMRLFGSREIVLAGWVHYLTFDLLIGAWIVRAAARAALPFALVVPCLFLTFMFGPVGFLAFTTLRAARALAKPQASGIA